MRKNPITGPVVSLSVYRDYDEIATELRRNQNIPIDPQQLWELVGAGFDFLMLSQWLADDFDDYDRCRGTPSAFRLLVDYVQTQLARESLVATTRAAPAPKRAPLNPKPRKKQP